MSENRSKTFNAHASIAQADLANVLVHTELLWNGMHGKKIFMTGGTGFFGKWLLASFAFVNEALSLGAEMKVLSRNPELFIRDHPHIAGGKGISFCQGDVIVTFLCAILIMLSMRRQRFVQI